MADNQRTNAIVSNVQSQAVKSGEEVVIKAKIKENILPLTIIAASVFLILSSRRG